MRRNEGPQGRRHSPEKRKTQVHGKSKRQRLLLNQWRSTRHETGSADWDGASDPSSPAVDERVAEGSCKAPGAKNLLSLNEILERVVEVT